MLFVHPVWRVSSIPVGHGDVGSVVGDPLLVEFDENGGCEALEGGLIGEDADNLRAVSIGMEPGPPIGVQKGPLGGVAWLHDDLPRDAAGLKATHQFNPPPIAVRSESQLSGLTTAHPQVQHLPAF
jgi:hypothetical protein